MAWQAQRIPVERQCLRVLVVGTDPSWTSYAAGHYWQNKGGIEVWQALQAAGLKLTAGQRLTWDDEAAVQGVGFTDLIHRPLKKSKDGSPNPSATTQEQGEGIIELLGLVRTRRPRLLLWAYASAEHQCRRSAKNAKKFPDWKDWISGRPNRRLPRKRSYVGGGQNVDYQQDIGATVCALRKALQGSSGDSESSSPAGS